MKYRFFITLPTRDIWELLERSSESMCFFSESWNSYLNRMNRKTFLVGVKEDNKTIGYFVGSRIKFGIKIISAPSMGTGTYSQGLCMLVPCTIEERIEIYKQLLIWLFENHEADYAQICDWRLRTDSKEWKSEWSIPLLDMNNIYYTRRSTYYLDTRRPIEELWANLNYKSCKYSINKARKLGLVASVVEKEEDIPSFVRQHHKHILDVLKRKKNTGLPCQHEKYMLALCQSLFPDRILMIQIIGNDENGERKSMASAIFALDKCGSSYFTSGSFQQYMHFCPNELLLWEAIRILNERGAGDVIFGGVAHYKKKFDPLLASVPVIIFSRWKCLLGVRTKIKNSYAKAIHIMARIKRRG